MGVEALTHRIQNGGTEVVAAKAGAGFALSLVRAINGETGQVVCSYVESDVVPECQWFSTEVEIGKEGIVRNLGLGELDDFEKQKLAEAITELKPSIEEGVDFVKNN